MVLTFKNKIILIIILGIHIVVLNYLAKLLCARLHVPYLLRPLEKCKNLKNEWTMECIGMPSGHAQTITIFSYILYKYNYISIEFLFLFISIVCAQRILHNKHTFLQVLIGVLIGLFYGEIYSKTKLSFISLCVSIFFTIFILLILLFIDDNKTNDNKTNDNKTNDNKTNDTNILSIIYHKIIP